MTQLIHTYQVSTMPQLMYEGNRGKAIHNEKARISICGRLARDFFFFLTTTYTYLFHSIADTQNTKQVLVSGSTPTHFQNSYIPKLYLEATRTHDRVARPRACKWYHLTNSPHPLGRAAEGGLRRHV